MLGGAPYAPRARAVSVVAAHVGCPRGPSSHRSAGSDLLPHSEPCVDESPARLTAPDSRRMELDNDRFRVIPALWAESGVQSLANGDLGSPAGPMDLTNRSAGRQTAVGDHGWSYFSPALCV